MSVQTSGMNQGDVAVGYASDIQLVENQVADPFLTEDSVVPIADEQRDPIARVNQLGEGWGTDRSIESAAHQLNRRAQGGQLRRLDRATQVALGEIDGDRSPLPIQRPGRHG